MNMLAAPSSSAAADGPERFSVSAPVSLQERRYHTIKSGDTFAVLDQGGDILSTLGGTDGLYHQDTRHLSRFDLTLGDTRPLLLSSALADDNLMLTSDVSNASGMDLAASTLDQGLIHVQRSTFVSDGSCHGRLSARSFAFFPAKVRLELRFDADFADLFEVRGLFRERRGKRLVPALTDADVILSYEGLDSVWRGTRLSFDPAPTTLTEDSAVFELEIEPRARATVFFLIECARWHTVAPSPRSTFLAAYVNGKRKLRSSSARSAKISSELDELNLTLDRSAADLRMLVTEKPTGPYPYAGIPWFSTAFGRDALITALLTLVLDPMLARGVLRYLSQEQATEFDTVSEAEPGKILHEMRAGEMASLREVPFGRYYGSIDATPLFVMLAGAYLDRTGELDSVRTLWPNVELALNWIDRRADQDGFISYSRSSADGLTNQGWKDSFDAISHTDGTLARGPIALCEVQGYVYAARLAGASIARRLGLGAVAEAQARKAEHLRRAFEDRFWCERLGTYALALDGERQQCQVRSSNAGQVLMTGIATGERARIVADGLMHSRFFSGWGIRTLAADEARYNPMSYHNGSVWPHDNALIAVGMARMGLRSHAARLCGALHAAAGSGELHRLPELFCGFNRRPGQGPIPYPVACSPQAWAAAAVPAVLLACLGLSFNPEENTVRFERPNLPSFLNSISLHNLSSGSGQVSVQISRNLGEMAVRVIEREGDMRVITTV